MFFSIIAVVFAGPPQAPLPKTDQRNSADNSSYQPNYKTAASSESSTDSFDVNPLNRWTVSNTRTLSSIDTSNLKNINVGNSSNSYYSATRQALKSDSKLNFRYQSSLGTNTSEYFRDVLGTPMTFDSSTQGWVTSGSTTVTQSNGELKTVVSSNGGVTYTFTNVFSKNVFTNISFDIYCSSALTLYVYAYYSDSSMGNYYKTFSCTTTKTNQNLLFSSFSQFSSSTTKEPILVGKILFYSVSAITFYLDNIQLLGSYNYPTMHLGNNWGFDSSLEYFYDSLGNISNFQDGTTENFTALTPSLTTSSITFADGSYPTTGEIKYINSSASSIITKTGTFSTSGSIYCPTLVAPYLATFYFRVSLDGGSTYTTVSSLLNENCFSPIAYSFSDTSSRITTTNALVYQITVYQSGV